MFQVRGVRLFPLWLKKGLHRCNYTTVMMAGMVTAATADVLIAIAIWILVIKS